MKFQVNVLVLILLCLSTMSAFAVHTKKHSEEQIVSMDEFLEWSPNTFTEKTGKSLSLKEKLIYRMLRKNIKRKIKHLEQKTDKILDDCDIIFLKSGEELVGKVMEITPTEIKYKACDFLDGPLITISKSEAFMIKYSNEQKVVIGKISVNSRTEGSNRQPEGVVDKLAIASISSAGGGLLFILLGLAIPGIGLIGLLAFIASIILGFMSLKNIRNNPSLKGKGLAWTGIGVGIGFATIFLIGLIALLALI